MPRIICIAKDGATCRNYQFKYGEAWIVNRWYARTAIEERPDAFALWSAELEAECSPPANPQVDKATIE